MATNSGGWQGTVAKTAAYSILVTDNGTTFTNRGDGDSLTFTLPTASGNANMHLRFVGYVNQNIIVAGTATQIVTFNNAGATSLAMQTSGQIIGGVIEAWCDGTSWFLFGTSVGHTYTVA